MIKQIALLKTKAGMSRDAFIKRYEDGHVPVILKLMPFFHEYRRTFVRPETLASGGTGGTAVAPDFDVITELWFEGQANLDRLAKELAETNIGELIAEDETHLFDRGRMAMFTVDERHTPAHQLAPRPAGHRGLPAVKIVFPLTKKPGMSRDAFIDYYETGHAPLAMRLLMHDGKPVYADYRRSYPIPGTQIRLGTREDLPEIGFDVLTEAWFWTEADYQAFQDICAKPDFRAAIAKDEENLFDRSRITMFLADERRCTDEEVAAAAAKAA